MYLVVAVDQNWAIGHQGDLLFRISADLKHFRALTAGKIVVYGRKTLETFPGAKPLPKRENIILSHTGKPIDGAIVAGSTDELRELLRTRDMSNVVIIGGASVYNMMLPYCERAYVTKIEAAPTGADAFIENLDKNPDWYVAEQGETQTSENGTKFHFDIYQNKKVIDFLGE